MSSIDRRSFLVASAGTVASMSLASAACAAPAGQREGASTIQVPVYKPIALDHLKGGLEGISANQLEQHAKLYNGYVTRTNALIEKTARMVAEGKHLNDQKAPVPEYAELKRRMGWEFNGMVLHEHYFQNLKKGSGDIPAGSALAKVAERDFGSIQNWWGELMATAKMPGVGWVICCQDPGSGRLFNQWVSMHEEGHVAGFRVILALDLWEHAFIGDYQPTERGKYLAAFEKNVDWEAAGKRLL